MKQIVALILVLALTLGGLFSCGMPHAVNLMKSVKPGTVSSHPIDEVSDAAAADFAVRLFKASMKEGENTLISPLSVMSALAMTANGAKGTTLAQMEDVLGMPVEGLNYWLYEYLKKLSGEKSELRLANSIWFTDEAHFSVKEDFLQTCADYYGADIFRTTFNNAACREINSWVKERTAGMIRDILDEIPEEAVMYLVNALAFEAEWKDIYDKNQVGGGTFTTEDESTIQVDMMYCDENHYLKDEHAEGFLKFYKGAKFAFAALLPEKGMSVAEYVETLTGERLYEILSSPKITTVETAIPVFSTEYDVEMSEILKSMGMVDAFDGSSADLSGLGHSEIGDLYISRVLHKTRIDVDSKGTKAGAATVVEVCEETAMAYTEEPKRVILDRPFVYMLIDCETKLPFFIGTMMDVSK